MRVGHVSIATSRREYLREYLLACLRDSVLSWSDLASGDAFGKLLKVVSADTQVVIRDLSREGASKVAHVAGQTLASALGALAEDFVSKRRRR